jgi:hypothetical protein
MQKLNAEKFASEYSMTLTEFGEKNLPAVYRRKARFHEGRV